MIKSLTELDRLGFTALALALIQFIFALAAFKPHIKYTQTCISKGIGYMEKIANGIDNSKLQ